MLLQSLAEALPNSPVFWSPRSVKLHSQKDCPSLDVRSTLLLHKAKKSTLAQEVLRQEKFAVCRNYNCGLQRLDGPVHVDTVSYVEWVHGTCRLLDHQNGPLSLVELGEFYRFALAVAEFDLPPALREHRTELLTRIQGALESFQADCATPQGRALLFEREFDVPPSPGAPECVMFFRSPECFYASQNQYIAAIRMLAGKPLDVYDLGKELIWGTRAELETLANIWEQTCSAPAPGTIFHFRKKDAAALTELAFGLWEPEGDTELREPRKAVEAARCLLAADS